MSCGMHFPSRLEYLQEEQILRGLVLAESRPKELGTELNQACIKRIHKSIKTVFSDFKELHFCQIAHLSFCVALIHSRCYSNCWQMIHSSQCRQKSRAFRF
jgi:hypothetical protein